MAVLISEGVKGLKVKGLEDKGLLFKGLEVKGIEDFLRMFIFLGFVIWSMVYLLLPQFHREDWKSLASSLSKQAKVYMILSSSDALSYYRSDVHLVDVQSIKRLTEMDNELIVIPYTTEIYGLDYKTNLKDRGYKMTQEKTYRGLLIEYWKKV